MLSLPWLVLAVISLGVWLWDLWTHGEPTIIFSSLAVMFFYLFALLGYLVVIIGVAAGKMTWCSSKVVTRKSAPKKAPPAPALVPGGRLYRSGRERILGGVCGGIAEYLGVDPVLVRILWVAGTLAWGFGVILYIIMWIIMPRNPKHKWDD